MSEIRRVNFDINDLELVKGPHVVLATGGPLMRIQCVEGDLAICAWDEWTGDWRNGHGVKYVYRKAFNIASLRKLAPVTKEEAEGMVHEPA